MPAKPPPKTHLTRADMVATLKRGESVMHDGVIITREEDLPTEADLAQGDPVASKAAVTAIDAQLASLTAQRAALTTPPKPAAAEPAARSEAEKAPEATRPPDRPTALEMPPAEKPKGR